MNNCVAIAIAFPGLRVPAHARRSEGTYGFKVAKCDLEQEAQYQALPSRLPRARRDPEGEAVKHQPTPVLFALARSNVHLSEAVKYRTLDRNLWV